MELSPGTILLGKYRIEELVGTGGMGNVVRASHLYLQQAVAIKVLLTQMAEDESTKQRFLREAQATVKLKSEHSARVMDVGTTPEGIPFMVMEFLDGNDLNQILRHHGPQTPAIVVDLMLQACEGIAEAHALGIIHRDVKPSNFFITRRPDGSMLLKILDFGISKTPVGYDELTGTQTVIGTPSYMAPEQMKSGRSADPRSDIWSIGVVMYQLIAGRLPFSGESYAELVLKVGLEPPEPMMVPLPPGLGEVILRCLEKDPNARHQNVGDLARMLAPYATDPQSAAQSASRAGRILQNRGAQMTMNSRQQFGMQGSPFAMAGGMAGLTPVPISPAQLTPRAWPVSQATSLSQGSGQVTLRTRGHRGLVIAGITSLCVIAAAGGYIVSQASRRGVVRSEEPHVPMSAVMPATPATPALTPPVAPPTPPTPAVTPPVTPPAGAGSGSGSGSNDGPWRDYSTQPTISSDPADKPAGKLIDVTRPAEPDKPEPVKTVHTDDAPRPRPRPAVHADPPRPRPAKPKKDDDLFNSRK